MPDKCKIGDIFSLLCPLIVSVCARIVSGSDSLSVFPCMPPWAVVCSSAAINAVKVFIQFEVCVGLDQLLLESAKCQQSQRSLSYLCSVSLFPVCDLCDLCGSYCVTLMPERFNIERYISTLVAALACLLPVKHTTQHFTFLFPLIFQLVSIHFHMV